jgi:hypothetical protein
VVVEVELQRKAHDQELEKNQPEATAAEKSGQLRLRHPSAGEIGACSGEKGEDGRAEMGDPAGKEERPGRRSKICRLRSQVAEEIVNVVQGHDDYDQPAQEIDRWDARASERVARSGRHTFEHSFGTRRIS